MLGITKPKRIKYHLIFSERDSYKLLKTGEKRYIHTNKYPYHKCPDGPLLNKSIIISLKKFLSLHSIFLTMIYVKLHTKSAIPATAALFKALFKLIFLPSNNAPEIIKNVGTANLVRAFKTKPSFQTKLPIS